MTTDVLITLKTLRLCPNFKGTQGFCASGMRTWFEANGLDYRDFLRNGIPASKLEAVGDPFAMRAVEFARKDAGHG